MEKLKKMFSNWTKFDYAWFIIANTVILSLSLYWGDGLIPTISALTGVTCVIFISKRMVLNYVVGAINVSLYAYLAYQSRLYGDCMLNALYYLPMQFIGLYMWSKALNKDNTNEVESKSLNAKQRIKLLCISLCCIVIYSGFLHLLGGNLVFIDSASTILAAIAMMLMVKQYMEQWYLWVIVNSISIIMWAISISQGSGNYSTLLMWIIYLLNSLYGLYNWRKQSK